jgi:hypothetical protein
MGIAQVPAATRPRRTKTEEKKAESAPPADTPEKPQPEAAQPEATEPAQPQPEQPEATEPAQPQPEQPQPEPTQTTPASDAPAESQPAATSELPADPSPQPAEPSTSEQPPVDAPAAGATDAPALPAVEAPISVTPSTRPAPATSEEVFSSDPVVTPSGAPLVFRPRRPTPTVVVATAPEGASGGETKPSDAPVDATAGAPAQPAQPGVKSEGRPIDPTVREALLASIDSFVSVDDGREPFRKIWIARRLAEKGILLERAEKLAAEALEGAATASEPERSVRDLPELDRDARLAVLTARAEDTIGWVLLKRGALGEALDHLARASAAAVKDSDYRQRLWHYAIAKQESGDEQAALDLYIRGFDPAAPSAPLRRRQIEDLYRKLNNGSLDGLDQRLAQQ